MEQEQRWLPELSARLPLPIPVPVRIGRPGCGYPWPWSLVPWLPGESALVAPAEPTLMAVDLGQFLSRLHQPAPEDAPLNPWRGIPLATRDQAFRTHLQQLGGLETRMPYFASGIVRFRRRHGRGHRYGSMEISTRAICSYGGPPLGCNRLWRSCCGRSGNRSRCDVDVAAGGSATGVPESARGPFNTCDEDTQIRALGWALALGLSWLSNSGDDETMRVIACATIGAALIPVGSRVL